jgi:peptidoglycan/xylan/chitin deacetylase (PgdA/CDA1 family)
MIKSRWLIAGPVAIALTACSAGTGGRALPQPAARSTTPPATTSPRASTPLPTHPPLRTPGALRATPHVLMPSPIALPLLGPAGDQPIGFHFPPAPKSFSALAVPPGRGAAVSLTFDDGPDVATPQILQLLEQARVTATFCSIGEQARQLSGLVRRQVRDHMTLCDHSRDHAPGMPARSRAFVRAEIRDGLLALHQVAPDAPVPFYRQPYGEWSSTIISEITAVRLQPLRWTTDPRDWSTPGAVAIAQRVLLRLQPNGVILLHDGGGDRSQTVVALHWLLHALLKAGWTFTTPRLLTLSTAAASRPE